MDCRVGGVEGYVGSVEGGVFVDVVCVGWVLYDDLFSEWLLVRDVVNELGKGIS